MATLPITAEGDTGYVLCKLAWMRTNRIWPNCLRYLWTDAFGVVLLVSLYRAASGRRHGAAGSAAERFW